MFSRRPAVLLLPLVLMLAFVLGPSATTAPTSATIAGDLQSELGCPGDWAPDCSATDLTPTDGVFVRSFVEAVQAAKRAHGTIEGFVESWRIPDRFLDEGYVDFSHLRSIRADVEAIWNETP